MSLFNFLTRALLWLLMSVLPLTLTACSALKTAEEHPIAARLIVGQIVGQYLDSKSNPTTSALNIIAAAKVVKEASTGESLTLLEFRELALQKAKVHELSPADRDAAVLFIDLIVSGIQKKVGEGKLEGLEELTTLREVADWAMNVALMYVN